MNGKTLTATAYPPQSSPKKGSRKLLVIALLLIIIIVSAGVLVYLATRPSSTGTPTPTPTGTATPTPSGTNPAANWRAGSWAKYIVKTYDTFGQATSENTLKYTVNDGTYNGTACWLLTMEGQINQTGVTVNNLITYWLNKNTFEYIHMKTQTYINDELFYEDEEDLSPGETGNAPDPIDMTAINNYETITVPAGTFNCGKITATVDNVTSSSWANSGIPILGLVKLETTSGGVLTSTTELESYHS